MTVTPVTRSQRHGGDIIDCDIHPAMESLAALDPFLSQHWRKHLATYGEHVRQAMSKTLSYPRMQPANARGDAWPPGGGPPGSDLAFMRKHHLDAHKIAFGILMPLRPAAASQRNPAFGAALCTAVNDWQIEAWTRPEKRLKGSILVPQEEPDAAVAEITRQASNPDFVQIALPPRTAEPLGKRRYWPIYRAAVEHGLPIGLHISGIGGHATTGSGWPSFYIEDHQSNVQSAEAVVVSMVVEGVFEQFPALKIVFIESGFAWVPALSWRLDKHWARLRDEVPHLKRAPSEYIREHIWYTTQPIEEPEQPRHLLDLMSWVGWDRIMFSTDYPHWDFDDPKYAFKVPLTDEQRRLMFHGNAQTFYGLP